MMQRESLPLTKHERSLGMNGKRVLQLCICEYFLTNQNTFMPLVFLDVNEIQRVLRIAYDYADKMDKEPLGVDVLQVMGSMDNGKISIVGDVSTYDPTEIMSHYTISTMDEIAGCLLTFDSDQSLLVVGSASSYYMIDVPNAIFTNSSTPEYDVLDYARLHGSIISVEYIKKEEEKEPDPPKPKKKKVTITTKDS